MAREALEQLAAEKNAANLRTIKDALRDSSGAVNELATATAGAGEETGHLSEAGQKATEVFGSLRSARHPLMAIGEIARGGTSAVSGLAMEGRVLVEVFESMIPGAGELLALFTFLTVGAGMFAKSEESAEKATDKGKGLARSRGQHQGIEGRASRGIWQPSCAGTPTRRHRSGHFLRGDYSADQVRAVRGHYRPFSPEDFPLRGEVQDHLDVFTAFSDGHLLDNPGLSTTIRAIEKQRAEWEKKLVEESKRFPSSYPVAAFLDICRARFIEAAPDLLANFCLDPACTPERLRISANSESMASVFDDLHGAILEYMDRWEKRHLAKLAITKVGQRVLNEMKYAEAERTLVLIEGVYGTGKTFPAKAWCEARPGKRRYMQCPSSNDSLDFFRTLAEPIGVSNALSMKGSQMRSRVNDVLQAGHLSIVIDESHYLFPQASTRVAMPVRINWVMTALTNYNVPVIMVATPQFMESRSAVERNTFWAAGQLDGRISRYVELPEELEESDLRAISRMHLPYGDEKSINALVQYALASKKRLRGIEHGVKSAQHVARCAGRDKVTFADIKQAMKENLLPSDSALNAALSKASKPAKAGRQQRSSKVYAASLHEPSNTLSTPVPERAAAETLSVTDRQDVRPTASPSLVET